jgi:hypothetical protein
LRSGRHRTLAAIAAGIKTAELEIFDYDDQQALRVYATENATQRGNLGTTRLGSVAAALRLLARAIATGNLPTIVGRLPQRAIEVAQATFERGDGVGQDLILAVLKGVPGISERTVIEDLANLKSSGDYARILREVKDRIEAEEAEAEKQAEPCADVEIEESSA